MYLDLTILTISFIPSIVTLTKSYTTISDVWIDNFIFNDNGNNGWKDIGNYCGSQGCTQDDPMKNGSLNTYHGPYHSFQGDGQSTTHYLSQYFYCLYPSNIHISYTIGACNGDFDDHYKFYFNNSEIDTFDGNEPNNNFNDSVLNNVCLGWQNIGRMYNDIAIVDANQLFEPKWEFFMGSDDYFIVYLIEITCDGTPYPTTTQPTFSPISPTDSPTHLPSTTPSISPSNNPSRYPSISPSDSEVPSNSPSTNPTATHPTRKADGEIQTTFHSTVADNNANGTRADTMTLLFIIIIIISVVVAMMVFGCILFCILYHNKGKSMLANQLQRHAIELSSNPEDIVMVTPTAGAVITNDDDIVAKIMINVMHAEAEMLDEIDLVVEGSQNVMKSTDNDVVSMVNTIKDVETDIGNVNSDAILSAVNIQSRQAVENMIIDDGNKEEMEDEGFDINEIFVDDKSESNDNNNQTNKTTRDESTTTGGANNVTGGDNDVDNQNEK